MQNIIRMPLKPIPMTELATLVAHSSILSSESGPLRAVVTGHAGRTYPFRSRRRLTARDAIPFTQTTDTDTFQPDPPTFIPSPPLSISAPPSQPQPPPPPPTSSSPSSPPSSPPPPSPPGTTISDSFPPIKASSAPPPPPSPSHSSSHSPPPSSSAPVPSSPRSSPGQSMTSASSSTDVSGNTVFFVPSVASSSTIPSSTSAPTVQGSSDPPTHVPVTVVATVVPIFLLLLLGSILITLYRRRRRGGPETDPDKRLAIAQWRQHLPSPATSAHGAPSSTEHGAGLSVHTTDASPTTPISATGSEVFLLPTAQEPPLSPRRLHDPEKAQLATRDVEVPLFDQGPTSITPTETPTGTAVETRVRTVSRAPTFRTFASSGEPLPEYSRPLPPIPLLPTVA
ncbi:hypothetical protein FB45DRAFT_48473 [Roridomyces roridus]|uniref:Uncharacterized protein n=1 Tax=Roridomyces roridus TaxID=1738132 RepID=A0AAD7BSL4_9AGAR|nr:hypothetical protein FB45DRAFT_48473 [Roridomyces roridus]